MGHAPHPYLELLAARASAAAMAWWSARCEALDAANFAVVFAGSGRRFGAEPVVLGAEEAARMEGAGLPSPAGWPLSGLARTLLLVRACERLDPSTHVELVTAQFRTGDNAEREAVLRTLPLLPVPERFIELGVEACRTHVQTVFEAIACENPYPARCFPDNNFNQLVLKSFFTGVAVRRIVGLAARTTPELVRMARAYASERRAAGRSVPDDLILVTAAGGTPGA